MKRHLPIKAVPLGDVDVSTILKYASKLPQYAEAIAEVIDDPYLPETACRVTQVYQARHDLPVKTCTPTVAGAGSSGIGLNRAIPVMRYVTYAERHKWVYPVTVAAILGIPFLLGYQMGRGR
jgi:hypothetical protein